MGKIVAICGIDGAGKTTTIDYLYDVLVSHNYKVKKIKVQLKSLQLLRKMSEKLFANQDKFYEYINPLYIRIGVAYDFALSYMNEDDYDDYDYILCDRYDLCYKAYGKAHGVNDMSFPNMLFDMAPKPELYVFLNIEPKTAMKRIEMRGYEKTYDEELSILTQTDYYYKQYIRDYEKVLNIDALLKTEEIVKQIILKLKSDT